MKRARETICSAIAGWDRWLVLGGGGGGGGDKTPDIPSLLLPLSLQCCTLAVAVKLNITDKLELAGVWWVVILACQATVQYTHMLVLSP